MRDRGRWSIPGHQDSGREARPLWRLLGDHIAHSSPRPTAGSGCNFLRPIFTNTGKVSQRFPPAPDSGEPTRATRKGTALTQGPGIRTEPRKPGGCYGLNVCAHPHSYLEALTPVGWHVETGPRGCGKVSVRP